MQNENWIGTFKTMTDAEKYFNEEVATGNDIGHMCTSRCGNDIDCPICPDFQTWIEEEAENMSIFEIESTEKSDAYDSETCHSV